MSEENQVPLSIICNCLNEHLEQSPNLMSTLLSLIFKAPITEMAESRAFSAMSGNGSGVVILDIIGFLSGFGDGTEVITAEHDPQTGKLIGFKTVSVNKESEETFM